MDSIFTLLIICFIIFLPALLIVLIAFLAAKGRKKKQNALLSTVPSNADFSATVRYNRGKQQDKFLKLKAFEGSGVVYATTEEIVFKSTKGFTHTFDLRNCQIRWEGENLVNGLLKWFSVEDAQEKIFMNVETGVFIFHTGGDKPTTRSIYEQLAMKQVSLK